MAIYFMGKNIALPITYFCFTYIPHSLKHPLCTARRHHHLSNSTTLLATSNGVAAILNGFARKLHWSPPSSALSANRRLSADDPIGLM